VGEQRENVLGLSLERASFWHCPENWIYPGWGWGGGGVGGRGVLEAAMYIVHITVYYWVAMNINLPLILFPFFFILSLFF
jgi:hypothetical protein